MLYLSYGRFWYHKEICEPNSSHKTGSIREGYSFLINMSKVLSTSIWDYSLTKCMWESLAFWTCVNFIGWIEKNYFNRVWRKSLFQRSPCHTYRVENKIIFSTIFQFWVCCWGAIHFCRFLSLVTSFLICY